MDIPIQIDGRDVYITINGAEANPYAVNSTSLEARYQIKEGKEYEFALSDKALTLQADPIVIRSDIKGIRHTGRIKPNVYVGTLPIEVISIDTLEKKGRIEIEVLSVKTDYRLHYRQMLDDIAKINVNLILQHSSPVVQKLAVNPSEETKTTYQQFAFLKSILDSDEFRSAIERIIHLPSTCWTQEVIETDIRRAKRIDGKTARQFASSKNRISTAHLSDFKGPKSVPARILQYRKKDSINTPENKFVKYALGFFLSFLSNIRSNVDTGTRLSNEALQLENQLSETLNHSFFREISHLKVIPLNNPVLQRKEGYRDVLRTFLLFDLAAKLKWDVSKELYGEEIYGARKKNVAVLYEYWLFFQLLKVVEDLFEIDRPSFNDLIQETEDSLGINLIQGRPLKIKGSYTKGTRKLLVEFHYNKPFNYSSDQKKQGSWTKGLRPDYTISLWPEGLKIDEAEEQVLVTHIHFDAKYKVEDVDQVFGGKEYDDDLGLQNEKKQQSEGNYKRIDLLKMHAYRDAIRRTGGAYIIYPGDNDPNTFNGFHEIIPGLGAFAVNPSSPSGTDSITLFLKDVLRTLENRASQWDRSTYAEYLIHKDQAPNFFESSFPEVTKENRGNLPHEISVLVGYIRSKDQENWIKKNNKYNTRTGSARGGLKLSSSETSADYLLLYDERLRGDFKIYQLSSSGPTIVTVDTMKELDYPHPNHDLYLIFDIVSELPFTIKNCFIDQLPGFESVGKPFSVRLSDLVS
jgi:predicted component of viral defense system (DUF524 family)